MDAANTAKRLIDAGKHLFQSHRNQNIKAHDVESPVTATKSSQTQNDQQSRARYNVVSEVSLVRDAKMGNRRIVLPMKFHMHFEESIAKRARFRESARRIVSVETAGAVGSQISSFTVAINSRMLKNPLTENRSDKLRRIQNGSADPEFNKSSIAKILYAKDIFKPTSLFDVLPAEIILHIITFLKQRSYEAFAQTCVNARALLIDTTTLEVVARGSRNEVPCAHCMRQHHIKHVKRYIPLQPIGQEDWGIPKPRCLEADEPTRRNVFDGFSTIAFKMTMKLYEEGGWYHNFLRLLSNNDSRVFVFEDAYANTNAVSRISHKGDFIVMRQWRFVGFSQPNDLFPKNLICSHMDIRLDVDHNIVITNPSIGDNEKPEKPRMKALNTLLRCDICALEFTICVFETMADPSIYRVCIARWQCVTLNTDQTSTRFGSAGTWPDKNGRNPFRMGQIVEGFYKAGRGWTMYEDLVCRQDDYVFDYKWPFEGNQMKIPEWFECFGPDVTILPDMADWPFSGGYVLRRRKESSGGR